MSYCPSCGSASQPNATFCTGCGRRVDQPSSDTSPLAVTPSEQPTPRTPAGPVFTAAAPDPGGPRSPLLWVGLLVLAVLVVGGLFMLVSSNDDKAPVADSGQVGAPTASASAATSAPAPTPTVTKTKIKTKTVTPAPPPVQPYSGNARVIACDSTMPNGEYLGRGDIGESVAALQWALASLNYVGASGAPLGQDGQFGAQTERAVLSFQRNHGLPQDGIVDQRTWSTMNVSLRSFQGINRCY